ncbi:MAG: hypothetical protein QOG20_2493 [Pseudonocardiales bacterium]|jgi:putative serine protease PepD|nr:hypothetical protein [Pseudonocardiales bacterium]
MTPTRTLVPVIVAVSALVLAGCSATAPPTSATSTPSSAGTAPVATTASGLQQDYVNVVHAVLPSVVQITTSTGLGSGVVLDTKGDIVTNAHVVTNATAFQVQLASHPAPSPATLVGAYPPDDLAVIHLDQPPAGLAPAHFGDSSKLQIGDIVLAMGNPLGLTGSVTNGIVSASGRAVTEPAGGDSPGATLPQAIQTSAAINPGNSGGALADLTGEVIGVPTLAVLDPQTGGSAAPGIGFAIPSNLVTDIAGQLVAHGGHVVDSHRAELGSASAPSSAPTGNPPGSASAASFPEGPPPRPGSRPGR